MLSPTFGLRSLRSVASRAMPITPSGHGTSWVPPPAPSIFTRSTLPSTLPVSASIWFLPMPWLIRVVSTCPSRVSIVESSPHCSTTWPNRETVSFCFLVA